METKMVVDVNLEELKQKIPYKWKVQTVSKNKPMAQCVAYIDARDVMDLLDKVVFPGNWKDEYQMVGDRLMCGLSILIDNAWVTKWDTGTAGDIETEKSEVSDAFKRAAVKWGIGRFLYDLDFEWVTTNEAKRPDNHPYPVREDNGQRIWDLSEYINSKKKHEVKR